MHNIYINTQQSPKRCRKHVPSQVPPPQLWIPCGMLLLRWRRCQRSFPGERWPWSIMIPPPIPSASRNHDDMMDVGDEKWWKHWFLPREWGCWTYLILLGWDLMIWLIWIHVWELNPSFAVEHGFVSNAKLVVSPEVRESLLNSEQSEPWYFRVKRTVASNVSNITYISPFIRNGHAVPTSFGVEVSGDTGDPPRSNQGGLASASGATARHSGRRSRQRPLLLGVLIWTLSGNHGLNMFKWLNQWRWWD